FPDASGLPNPANRANFLSPAAGPVDLQVGPNGDLFYVDHAGGTIRRIRYFTTNRPPVADARADVTSGVAPLTVNFDGTHSSDPDPGDVITYAWDLDGDGQFDDATVPSPQFTYAQPGTYLVSLKVTDLQGASSVATLTITAGNSPPVPTITSPPELTT